MHTLPNLKGGVVNVFNINDEEAEVRFFIDSGILGGIGLKVHGAHEIEWRAEGCKVSVILAPMSHALITIGEAVEAEETTLGFRANQ